MVAVTRLGATARYFLLILPWDHYGMLCYEIALFRARYTHRNTQELQFWDRDGENPRVSLSLCRHQHSTGQMRLELLWVACTPADQEWRHIYIAAPLRFCFTLVYMLVAQFWNLYACRFELPWKSEMLDVRFGAYCVCCPDGCLLCSQDVCNLRSHAATLALLD